MTDPPLRLIDWKNCHRLIPSRFSERGTVLSALADNDRELADLVLLDGATNDRIQGEQQGLIGISTYELLYGVPNAHIVNAAFTHTSDAGSRFNDHTRGAWYAAGTQKCSIIEVAYHKARHLSDIVVPDLPDGRPSRDSTTYDDWLANFDADFHILDPPDNFAEFLKPEPVPHCYSASQLLARHLLEQGSNGLIYPSVRQKGSKCIACFRPALVYSPRRSERLEITLSATKTGYDHQVRRLPA